jgi:hypothetical protein
MQRENSFWEREIEDEGARRARRRPLTRQTDPLFLHKAQEIKLLIKRGLVPASQFLTVEAVFSPRNCLEPVGGNLFSAGLAFAVSSACHAFECIINLPEHATANAGRCNVDVLLNAADGEFHFISRLDSRKSFRIVPGAGQ